MDNDKVKNFIMQARKNGTSDDQIVSFLKTKGVDLSQPSFQPNQSQKILGMKAPIPADSPLNRAPKIFTEIAKPFARAETNLVNAVQTVEGKPITQPFSGKDLGTVQAVGFDENNEPLPFGKAVGDSLKTGLQIATTAGAPGETKIAETAATDIGENIVKPLVAKATEKIAERASEKATEVALDALNPELKGTKLSKAYKGVLTGKQEVIPASIFREQGLSAPEQVVNLEKRLSDSGIKLTKDPEANINMLKNALNNTEEKLTTALKSDPEVVYNADKGTLANTLKNISTTMPREFTAIKDNKTLFNSVVNFAQEVIGKAPDTIEGLRDARTAFDAQAMREYPSVFKTGQLDTTTPAGRAIKTVRDAMNEHLYNTAPNGSEIQKLIGQEADIFRANENIAPKLQELHGEVKGVVGKALKAAKENPLKTGLAAVGLDKISKGLTGFGL